MGINDIYCQAPHHQFKESRTIRLDYTKNQQTRISSGYSSGRSFKNRARVSIRHHKDTTALKVINKSMKLMKEG